MASFFPEREAFSLIELVLVVALLALVAALAIPRLGGATDRAKVASAESSAQAICAAINGTPEETGYISDRGGLPGFSPAFIRIHNLLGPTNVIGRGARVILPGESIPGYAPFEIFTNWNASAGRGWNGPYIATPSGKWMRFPDADEHPADGGGTYRERGFYRGEGGSVSNSLWGGPYGCAGELALPDPWGHPFVLQVPPPEAFDSAATDEERWHWARVVSAGPNGIIDTPLFLSDPVDWTDAENVAKRRQLIRLAGRSEKGIAGRGDDIVVFVNRSDVHE